MDDLARVSVRLRPRGHGDALLGFVVEVESLGAGELAERLGG